MEHLQYPIGKFTKGKTYPLAETKRNIRAFKAFPKQLKTLVKDWDDKTLVLTYREGGWTGRQVINHLGDSHAQLLLRFKSCLCDENPEIKPYDEDKWAKLYDGENSPINHSLQIVIAVHARLSLLFKNLDKTD